MKENYNNTIEKRNWIYMDIKNNINLERGRESFMLKKLQEIFLKWDINFFKITNLKKKKIKLSKINLYNNTFLFNFPNIKKLNIWLHTNKNILEKKLNVLNINYNGYNLNYNVILRWKFSKIIIEKVYINLFIRLICSLIIKVLLNIIIKSLLFIKYNYIIRTLTLPNNKNV